MKKIYLKSMLALTALFGLGTSVSAENLTGTVPVKMTYVSGSDTDVDVAYGKCDTIKAGWNLGNDVAVGTTIKFGNKGWGANWIGVLKADVSSIPGTVQKATLKAKVSGSLDSKRVTGWGVALTDNDWAEDLTYTTVCAWTVSAMLNGGEEVWTTGKSAASFEEISLDITDAFAGGKAVATLLVYEGVKSGNGGAAGGYMTEAEIEVEYEQFEATETKYDFEDGEIHFLYGTNSGSGRITAAIEADATLGSNVLGWTCADNAQNGYSFSYYNFSELLNQPALVKVEFDYYNTKGGRSIMTIGDALVRGTDGTCAKTSYSNKGAIFYIGSDKNNAFVNGITLKQDNDTTKYKVWNEELQDSVDVEEIHYGLCNRWLHVSVIANNDAKTVTWVVTDKEGNLIHVGSSDFFAADAAACTQIDLFGYINKSHCAMLDNLSITNYKSNAVFADYTIKYVDAEGNEIKDARSGNAQVGKFVKLLDSDKTDLYNADKTKKYIYDSDDSETVAIAESGTVISVKYRDAEVWNYVLNCMIEGTTGLANRLNQITGTFFEGDNCYIYPARGYGKDGKYYFTDATSYNGVTFAFPGSIAPATQAGKKYYIGTLYYSPVDSVAYYSDVERLALPTTDAGNGTGLGQLEGTVNSWWSFSGGIFDRFSQARGIRLDVDSYVWTEPIAESGIYKVTIYGRNDVSANQTNPYGLGIRDAEGNVTMLDVEVPDWASATTGANIVENVAIPAGSSLVIKNIGSKTIVNDSEKDNQISLDDISLTKTDEYVVDGVKEIKAAQVAEGAVYTIGGIMVQSANLKPGMYIKDGKVFVVK